MLTIQSQAQKVKWCGCISMHGSGWHCTLKLSCCSIINQYRFCPLCCLKFMSTLTVLTHSYTSLITQSSKASEWCLPVGGYASSLSSVIWEGSVAVCRHISNNFLYFLNPAKWNTKFCPFDSHLHSVTLIFLYNVVSVVLLVLMLLVADLQHLLLSIWLFLPKSPV